MNDLDTQRNYYVVKGNELIQKSRFSLPVQQMKVLLYLISKIQPTDEPGKLYTIEINDFCRVCGIDFANGKNYLDIKAAIKSIADKSIWITSPDGNTEILLRWIDRAIIEKNSGSISVRFHEDMFPYLLDLQERYTQYKLVNILPMRSKYGIRLYELLKSYENLEGAIVMSIEDLKKRLDCDKYTSRFPDFRRYALDKAIDDINQYSDISVSYRLSKENNSRAYNKITFFAYPVNRVEAERRNINRNRQLDG